MKAVYIKGKEDLEITDVEVPEPGDDQVRVAVDYVGICGSDLHYYFNGANGTYVVREPLIPGHEMSGRIDLDPKGEWAPGTPITLHPATFGPDKPGMEDLRHLRPGGSYLGSASTWPHTQGAMVEQRLVYRDQIRVLPEGVSLQTAALVEPLAVVIHGIKMIGDITGANVLVSGSGPIGLLAGFAAKKMGAARLTCSDVLDGPLERAKQIGADEVINVTEAQLPENSYDVILECSAAAPAVNACLVAAKPRGRIAQIGMFPGTPVQVTLAALSQKELTWVGTMRFDNEVDDAVQMVAEAPEVASVITHVIGIEDALEAFTVAKDSQQSGKVLVNVSGAEA